jgi:PAS domain S-box-containing protein
MALSEDVTEERPDGGLGRFAGGGEVGRDLAAVDWAATPLGPPARWPHSLMAAVSILLSSRFPMWMAWGPELTFFCNAAYRRDTLGRKYPWALGRPAAEVWAEIWTDIGPRIATVLTTGEATWDEALLLFLERSGYSEETYHTFSYSPLADDDGAVVGMLCVVTEDTDRVIERRRMATLRELGSDLSVVRTEEQMLAFFGEQFGHNRRDLPFCLVYLFDDEGGARLACATASALGHPAVPELLAAGQGAADSQPWPAARLARGESALLDLSADRYAGLPAGDLPQPPAEALAVPLLQHGSTPYGFLVAGLNRYRLLDESYRGFLKLSAGHVSAGIARVRSYRAQQRRAEELAELDRAKTAFFSNISHEFRTPLTLIMGPVQELRAGLGDADERTREQLEVIRRNGMRLGKLVNTLLDFSRIEAGRMQAGYELVDLSAMTAELASVFRSAIEAAGLEFTVDCPALPEPVYLDRGMWEKVVLNLLSNALKFTFDGSIRVTVGAAQDRAVVTVADTGIGVAPEEVPRLFERFHRVEDARSRSHEGSGIGLALVKELVGLLGGTIEAASVRDAGTVFTLRLPFGRAHLPAEAPVRERTGPAVSAVADPFVQEALRWVPAADRSAEVDGVAAGAAGMAVPDGVAARVLVADDNADMRDYLGRLLRGAGHEVTVVTDGLAAWEAALADPPDLIISDVMMPGMSGLELLGALREDQRTSSIPTLLLSARAGEEQSIEGLAAGADDYLVKPFSAADLLARVRVNVELARLRLQHVRWRTALVDSLQEAFFLIDERGAVIEANAAFAEVFGYGAEGLPYPAPHPWWPPAHTDPEARAQVAADLAEAFRVGKGRVTLPFTHRQGHRVWVSAAFNTVWEPGTGRRVIVGTCRDVTAERYAIQRESAIAAVSLRLSRAIDVDDALAGALDELRTLWGARSAVAAVFAGLDADPVVTDTGEKLSWAELTARQRALLAGLREGPLLTPSTDGERAGGVGVSLEHPRGPMALWIDLGARRPFGAEDRTLLTVLAGHLSQGFARAQQIARERETAIALQRAILGPARMPEGFSVRYEPAARPLKVGGDWYDTVELSEGRIGIVVGDCVGRGLEAATVMGQLRSACRALLLQDPRPDRVLVALDQFAEGIEGAMCTTVFCGVLDTGSGLLRYASAGHPPCIVACPDGSTFLLEDAVSLPLAVYPSERRPSAEHVLTTRSTLLLYTDGLVERRRSSLTEGIERAAATVQAEGDTFLDDLASKVLARLEPSGGYDDDVALLLYRHPAPLDLAFPAAPERLGPARAALRDWLRRCEVPGSQIDDILVAAGEASANAVEHGSGRTGEEIVRLRAEASEHRVRITVTDSGLWRPPQGGGGAQRGHGLVLMRAMMQDVAISAGDEGTTVDLRTEIE